MRVRFVVIPGVLLSGLIASYTLFFAPIRSETVLAEFWQGVGTHWKVDGYDIGYPKLAPGFQGFYPELDALLPHCPHGDRVGQYLKGQSGIRVFYSGYFLPNQAFLDAFLERFAAHDDRLYSRENAPNLREYGIKLSTKLMIRPDAYGGPPPATSSDRLARLDEGFERFYIYEIGNAGAANMVMAQFPILWEVPDEGDTGGWVLYGDGHREWLPYPGDFPMSEPAVSAIRRAMGPRGENISRRVKSIAPMNAAAPIKSPVYSTALEARKYMPDLECRLTACDAMPTVSVGKAKGYRVKCGADLVLFPMETCVDTAAKEYTEWARAIAGPNGQGRLVYLGNGLNYQWFATSGGLIPLDDVRTGLNLSGGDDRLELLKQALKNSDSNAPYGGWDEGAALCLLPRHGDAALPVLEEFLKTHSNRAVLASIECIDTPAAHAMLDSLLAPDRPGSAALAASVFLFPPRADPFWWPHGSKLAGLAHRCLLASTDYAALKQIALPLLSGHDHCESCLGREIMNRLPDNLRQSILNEMYAKMAASRDWRWVEEMRNLLEGRQQCDMYSKRYEQTNEVSCPR